MTFPRGVPFALFALFAILAPHAAACSSATTASVPVEAEDAGPPEAGAAETSTTPEPGKCNAVVNGASVIGETAGVGTRPTPLGGTIADGTYFLTKHEVFPPGNPGATTRKRTIVFTGNTFETHEDDPGRQDSQGTGTYTTSGSMITFTVDCFGGASVLATNTVPYTATATTFATFAKDADGDVFTSTKQ